MAVQGFNGHFELTAHDMSPYLDTITFQRGNDVIDITTFGQTAHVFAAALMNGKITLAGLWDVTAVVGSQTLLSPLVGNLVGTTFIYGPAGSTTGKVKYSGTIILDDYTESVPVADIVKFTASLQISGAVTVGVF